MSLALFFRRQHTPRPERGKSYFRTLYCRWLRRRIPHCVRILRMLLARLFLCYPNLATEIHPHRVQKTYQDLYEEIQRRAKALEDQGYTVKSIWEHKFNRLVQQNPPLQQFIQNLDIQDLLNPRDALYGDRTNDTRLYCEEGDMRYVDVCSLYPYILKYKRVDIRVVKLSEVQKSPKFQSDCVRNRCAGNDRRIPSHVVLHRYGIKETVIYRRSCKVILDDAGLRVGRRGTG
jgi:hypothetical protein